MLSATGGTLAPGATTNVTVSINADAQSLAVNTYSDTVSFTNASNGAGNATETVSLNGESPPRAARRRATDGFQFSGIVGGPFSPIHQTYSLTNMRRHHAGLDGEHCRPVADPLRHERHTGPWRHHEHHLSINANAETLAVGAYSDTISFTNASNGLGNTADNVSLLVLSPAAQLVVGPAIRL